MWGLIDGAAFLVSRLAWWATSPEAYRRRLVRKLARAQRRRLHWQDRGNARRWMMWAQREADLREELKRVTT